MGNEHGSPLVGLVTALPEEFAAVRVFLPDAADAPVRGDPNLYVRATVHAPGGDVSVVATQLVRPGNNVATASAAALLSVFPSIRDVIMVGVAAAVPAPAAADKHVRLGDIVVATEGVVQYDNVRVAAGVAPVLREAPQLPSAYLLSRVRRLASDERLGRRPWESYLEQALASHPRFARPSPAGDILLDASTGSRIRHPRQRHRRPGQPTVFLGRIGSANVLLRDPALRDRLREEHRVLAIEMEGSGISDGAWLHNAGYLVVRGTCDYADQTKNDAWHDHASVVAAAYTRALLDLYEPDAQSPPEDSTAHWRERRQPPTSPPAPRLGRGGLIL
jgi:nucleoside phosphorylase